MTTEWDNLTEWVALQPTLRWNVTDRRSFPESDEPFNGAEPLTINELIATGITARIGPTCSVLLCWMEQQGFGDEDWEDVGLKLGLSAKNRHDVLRRAVVRLILKFRWARSADGLILMTLPLRLAERMGGL